MIHRHHRKRRSQGGDDSPVNTLGIPDALHGWIHENPEKAYELGLLVKSHDDPAEIMVTIPEEFAKKPRKKREASRNRAVVSIRVPKDNREDGAEVLETLIDAAREQISPVLGYDGDVPAYFVLTAVLADWLNSPTTKEER